MRKLALLFMIPLLWAEEKVDLQVINRIKVEAFRNSKVMDHAFRLTEVYGPRLTGSPAHKAAAEWAAGQMREWGLTNPHLEKWGPYGRGWANLRFHAGLREPYYTPLVGVARPWTPGTRGPVSAAATLAVLRTEADLAKFKGTLKGKIVLIEEPRVLAMRPAPAKRLTDQELAERALAPDPAQLMPFAAFRRAPAPPDRREAARRFRNQLSAFLRDEGVLVSVVPGYGTDSGTVFTGPAGSRDPKDPLPPPSVALTPEHYNHIARLLDRDLPVTLEFDIENRLYEDDLDSYNVIADLPGGARKDEVVMIGAHLDSWTFGTGATDNAGSCAVMMEVMRILKTLAVKPARTIRVALWSGEEQGLLGAGAYVRQHFADVESMALKPEHKLLSGYFNMDYGAGRIRGVHLQSNDMMRPIVEAWLEPFHDLGATTVSIRDAGSTDHVAFDAVGLPGFQFIQDTVDYATRTHHSSMDVYDRLQPGDLMQAAAVISSIAYHAATREEMLPRKPLPKAKKPL